jgi:hypothetical protein
MFIPDCRVIYEVKMMFFVVAETRLRSLMEAADSVFFRRGFG